jgi:hypothetical protein
MNNLFTNLFCKKRIEKLEAEIVTLKEKLEQRQEVINQTNAFWKRKLYTLKKESNKKL